MISKFGRDVAETLRAVANQIGLDGPTAAMLAWLAWVVFVVAFGQNVLGLR